MKPYLAATILLALVACATPQQRCITKAAPDLPVLNRLIAETEGNLSRGYAFTEVEMEIPVWKLCRVDLTAGTGDVGQSLCLDCRGGRQGGRPDCLSGRLHTGPSLLVYCAAGHRQDQLGPIAPVVSKRGGHP